MEQELTITKAAVESFLEIPIHLPTDGSLNPLQSFLKQNSLQQIDPIILHFIRQKEYALMIYFIQRVHHYPGVIEELVQSPGFIEILRHGKFRQPNALFLFTFTPSPPSRY
jgi:hypothetical protein